MRGQAPAATPGTGVRMHRSSRACPRLARIAAERPRHPTSSEHVLWLHLQGGHLGVAFRREFVIGRFIVDLCAPQARLVVEIDGGYHARIAGKDARRDRALRRAGWRVLRLPAELVMAAPERAAEIVREALGQPDKANAVQPPFEM